MTTPRGGPHKSGKEYLEHRRTESLVVNSLAFAFAGALQLSLQTLEQIPVEEREYQSFLHYGFKTTHSSPLESYCERQTDLQCTNL